MSKPPSIRSALKRLTEWAAWQQRDYSDRGVYGRPEADNPYARCVGRFNHISDVALVASALTHVADNAEQVDSRDGNPVYEVKLEADWRAKGLLEALSEAVAQDPS